MRKYIVNFLMATALAAGFAACSSDDGSNPPVSISETSLRAEPSPGKITLHWDIPENADYYYVQVKYNLPDRSCTRMASVYADSMVIDNLLARYGTIDFEFQTFSKDGTAGSETAHISAQADPAEKQVKVTGEGDNFAFTKNELWTDSEDSNNPIERMVDGDNSTFFQMNWVSPTDCPHYMVFNLQKEISAFSFSYTCRDHNNMDNPSEMEIYVSNSQPSGDYNADISKAIKLTTLTGLPGEKAASYSSSQIISTESFQYIYFKVNSVTSGSTWVAISEFSIKELLTSIYDPETDE